MFYCDFRFSLSEVKLETGLQSHLVIQQADRQDSGLYICEADNLFGHSKQTTLLAVQGIVSRNQTFFLILTCRVFMDESIIFPKCGILNPN
jgi:hypothetical protein